MTETTQEMSFKDLVAFINESKDPEKLIRNLVFNKSSRPKNTAQSAELLEWIFAEPSNPLMTRAFSGIAAAHTLMNSCKFDRASRLTEAVGSLITENFDNMPADRDLIRENRNHLFFSFQAVAWQIRFITRDTSALFRGLQESISYFDGLLDSSLKGGYFFQTSANVFRIIGASSALAHKKQDEQTIKKNSIAMDRAFGFALETSYHHPVIKKEFQDTVRAFVFHKELANYRHLGSDNVMVESMANLLFAHSKRTRGVAGGADESGKVMMKMYSDLSLSVGSPTQSPQ